MGGLGLPKNRSPLSEVASRLVLEEVSSGMVNRESLRGLGDYQVNPHDMISGERHADSIMWVGLFWMEANLFFFPIVGLPGSAIRNSPQVPVFQKIKICFGLVSMLLARVVPR